MRRKLPLLVLVVSLSAVPVFTLNGIADSGQPVELTPATPLSLPSSADSNSPAVWDLVDGQNTFFVMTSINGQPSTAMGRSMQSFEDVVPADVTPWPGGGVWMEAVVVDDGGTWYGYYHNENVAAAECGPKTKKVIPRIGAARSTDHGATWQPLGIILEEPPKTYACNTKNKYFVGGVGDFSVMLDPSGQDLYIFYSAYMKTPATQGVSVARLAWADRDNPAGKAMVWRTRTWIPASASTAKDGSTSWSYPAGLPIFPAAQPWHDGNTIVDAFWGPSVHWNSYLNKYVMLLNHAMDENFAQEGIYVSYASRLDDPRLWSTPEKIYDGGDWYPQVLGLEDGSGTDKSAGQTARFFMGGKSTSLIRFAR